MSLHIVDARGPHAMHIMAEGIDVYITIAGIGLTKLL